MFKFEKLEVWQKAVDLSYNVHELTRNFPKEELYILTSQIKRAADSIALNISFVLALTFAASICDPTLGYPKL